MTKGVIILIMSLIATAMLITACAPSIGDVVSGDVWQVKVISVKNETTLEKSLLDPVGPLSKWDAEEGYSFLVVEVLIKNTSAEPQWYNSDSIALIDSDKRLYLPVGKDVVGGYELDVAWVCGPVGGGEESERSVWLVRQSSQPPIVRLTSSRWEESERIVFLVPDGAKGFYFKFLDLPEIYLGQ